MSGFTLVVPEDFEHVDHTLQTASWWDRYTIKAGEYPVVFTSIGYVPITGDARPYYATAKLDATLVETYRVNRLLWAESAQTEHPQEETVVHFTTYAYNIEPGRPFYDGHATIREEHSPMDDDCKCGHDHGVSDTPCPRCHWCREEAVK